MENIVEMYQIFDAEGVYLYTLSVSEIEQPDFDIKAWMKFYCNGGNYQEILASQKSDLTEFPSGNKI